MPKQGETRRFQILSLNLLNGEKGPGLLDGSVVVYDLATGKKSRQIKVGEKFCDAVVGPNGKHIYFADMASGRVYEWDFKTLKTVDEFHVGVSVCGIQWSSNKDKAYISEMPTGTIHVLDWKTKKEIKKITDPPNDLHPPHKDGPGWEAPVGSRRK